MNEPVLIALQLVYEARRTRGLVVNARARTLARVVNALTRGGDARLALDAIAHVLKGRTVHGGRVGAMIVGVQTALRGERRYISDTNVNAGMQSK